MITSDVRCPQTEVMALPPPHQRVRVQCVLPVGHTGPCLAWDIEQRAWRWRTDQPPVGPAPPELQTMLDDVAQIAAQDAARRERLGLPPYEEEMP